LRVNILYLAHSAKIGGATRSLLYLCKEIPGSSVLFPYRGAVIPEFETAGVCYRILRVPAFFYYQYNRFSIKQALGFFAFLWNIPRLIRLIIREKIDIVHCNEIVLAPAAAVIKTLLPRRVKTVMHVRALLPRPSDSMLNRIMRRLVQTADHLICIGPNEAAFYREERRSVLYNPVDFGDYRPRYTKTSYLHDRFSIPPAAIVAGVFAQLGKGKGHRTLVDCVELLKALDVCVILFGDGPGRAGLEAAARGAGLEGKIIFAGAVSNVFECMEGCDFLLRLEEYGYFGRDILEANTLGVPILATKNRRNTDGRLIREGENGYTFPPGDTAAFRRLFERMVSECAGRKKRKPAAFAADIMAPAYAARVRDIYDDLKKVTD